MSIGNSLSKMTNQEKIKVFNDVFVQGGLDYWYNMKQLMHFICGNFKLNESFIREYKDVIDWRKISTEQELSDINFLREFKDQLDWYYLGKYSRTSLSKEQKEEFKEYYD